MNLIELIINEFEDEVGIDAISIVRNPAIEENFVTLSKQARYELKTVDEEKRLLMGALLIPEKPIVRFNEETQEEYQIFFSKQTVRRASELFLKKSKQSRSTLEHAIPLEGLYLAESWIVEDSAKDKSALYDMDMPVGTWMGSVKVENDEVWNNYIKTGEVLGFSIEGYFAEKVEMSANKTEDDVIDALVSLLSKEELESYADYPDGVKSNARKALEYADKNGWGSCGTPVGKQRANQLAKGEAISVETIKRMYSFLSRHEANARKAEGYGDGCAKLMYDAWGGLAALGWSRNKLRELGEIEEDK